jgi:lysophospholipase L1-like esterase
LRAIFGAPKKSWGQTGAELDLSPLSPGRHQTASRITRRIAPLGIAYHSACNHKDVTMIFKALAILAAAALSACGSQSAPPVSPPAVSRPISNVVAFMGDSITYLWDLSQFDSGPTLNFGIKGDYTGGMLARFQTEVIANAPGVVVILGGINDIELYDSGVFTTPPDIESIKAMAAMAKAAGIRVILCSVLPTKFVTVSTPLLLQVPAQVEDLNQQLIALAQQEGYLYADYYDEMLAADGTQNTALFMDEVHPNPAGYAVMWKVIAPLLAEDLN